MEQINENVDKATGLTGLNHSKMSRARETYLRVIRAWMVIAQRELVFREPECLAYY